MDRLSKRERQDRILTRLNTTVAVRISDLAEEFDVTTETIRRDLDALAERGLLARTYGGAAMRALTDEPGIATRAQTNVAERERIALNAARLVKSGDVLIIDAGSTTAHLAKALAQLPIAFKAITNSIGVARILGQSETASVLLCPGDLRLTEEGVFGTETLDFLDRYHANLAFIGAGGFTASEISDADAAAVAVKRKVIARAERVYLLADHTKGGITQFATIAAWDAFDGLVTDRKPDDALARALAEAQVELRIAEQGKAGLAA
ncbi:MAG: DeoR/GlpR family DNA-binding transcription regulator [Parvibaculaceae bacterium]